jgi:hypothetical protein
VTRAHFILLKGYEASGVMDGVSDRIAQKKTPPDLDTKAMRIT